MSEKQKPFTEDELRDLNARFENASPQEILRWAAGTAGSRLVVVTSFQPTGIVTLHMLQDIAPQTPTLTLDTGLLFPETYSLMEQVQNLFQLNLERVRPVQTVEQQAQEYGAKLWERTPDQCCNLRKTLPLQNALGSGRFDAWITGLRRDQSSTRAETPIVSWDRRYQMLKLCPFATWTEEMIWTYLSAYELPYNTLHDNGYPSIGCFPCTQPVTEESDGRSGRWVNHNKTECGIHVTPAGE